MKKIEKNVAMQVLGGAMGCEVSHNLSIVEGKEVCYVTVGCVDKFGVVTSKSKPVERTECK
ncbi:hypothetical protein ACQKDS_09015 [Serratia sp. NPDC078593]|uniref:hypothetical protein n=1 Tax=unclassified Serratia (in: enterobacteria) TaxID=2647522 RepID=UPI0037CE6B4F